MAKTQIFLDADVIISAIISHEGASYQLMQKKEITLMTSDLVFREVSEVARRLGLAFSGQLYSGIRIIALKTEKPQLIKQYRSAVIDENDTHVIAGADAAGCGYLATYNLRHFRAEQIKQQYGIFVLKPGTILQFLRSRESGN